MSPDDLRDYQRALGMSDREFADYLCVNVRTFQRWKRDRLDIPGWVIRFLPAIVAFETRDGVSAKHLREIVRAR